MSINNCVTIEAATVKEAILKGLKKLNISKEQARVEVLSEGKQGFLGVGNQPASVRISVNEEAVVEKELADILSDLDIQDEALEHGYRPKVIDENLGFIEVKDGRIMVTNPQGEGDFAKIKPGKHIDLLVNGMKVADETPISEKDEIIVKLIHENPVSSFEVFISENEVEAHIRYISRPGVKYKLKDQGPTNELILLTEVEEIIEPKGVSVEEGKKFLQINNVVRSINEEVIKQAIDNPNSKEFFLAAQGQQPVDGKDAYIRYPFIEEQDKALNDNESLFERQKIVSVNKGDIVAYKVPMEEGKDGFTVSGQAIHAKRPTETEIKVGSGVEVIADGSQAVATMVGRPALEAIGDKVIVSIKPIYEVKDVDHTTGDIKFAGDIRITGDVKEGCTIEAGGNIEVLGNVTKATLKAGSGISVRQMVMGSSITAGGLSALYSSVEPVLVETKETLDKVFLVANELKRAAAFKTSDLKIKGDGQLIKLLIDSKFKNLAKNIEFISAMISESKQSVHEDILNTINLLKNNLCGLGPVGLDKIDYIKVFSGATEQAVNLIHNNSMIDLLIVRDIQSSTLQSSGDIIIEGSGCSNCSIAAGRDVIVAGSPGIAKGGIIIANRNVIIKEIDGDVSGETSVKIKGNGKISAEIIHSNVILQVGKEKFRVDRNYHHLDAYINHEGKLIIDKGMNDRSH